MKLIQSGITVAVLSITTLLVGCSASDMQTLAGGGEAISTSSVKLAPSNPARVKLYFSAPKHYQMLGRVSANNDNPMGIPHSQQSIYDELKSRAASLGANGVSNISSGMEQTTGNAILVK